MTSILEQMARAFQAELRRQGVLWEPEDDPTTLMMGTGESADLMPAIKAALQPLLGELPEEVTDAGRSQGPVVLVERDVGKPYARTLLPEEAQATFHAMIKAILEGGEG